MSDLIEAPHWSEVPAEAWPWPNFSPQEMASRGDGSLRMSRDAMDRLQRLRGRLGVPLIVHSAYRDPAYNRRVGGARRSQHMEGRAFDVGVANVDPYDLIDAALEEGFTSYGTYPDQGFVHIDTRPGAPARWGKPFPVRATRFSPEPAPRPARDVVRMGAPAAGVLVVAEQAVQEAAPFLPPDWVRVAFLGLALITLGGILWQASGRGDER